MAVVSVRLLSDAAWALLDAHPQLATYRSIVDPAATLDEAGVVQAYAVFHAFPGNDEPNDLARTAGPVLWSFQVDAVGGDENYLLWAVDAVRAQLTGKTLTVAGAKVGLLLPPPDFYPPTRDNTTVIPPRLEVPLQYQVRAVPA